jgi:hypothetical protein
MFGVKLDDISFISIRTETNLYYCVPKQTIFYDWHCSRALYIASHNKEIVSG